MARHALMVFMALGVLSTSALRGDTASAPTSEREAAVIQARGGDAKGGLLRLRALLQRHPDDSRLLADTTIVASWAGEDVLALELYARPQTPRDDAGVTEAAAHAARNLKQYDFSLQLYRHSEELEPEQLATSPG